VNAYPANNNVPFNGIATLVNATVEGAVITFTANNGIPNPAITTVATNSAGSAAAFAFATLPATNWYANGVPSGVIPAVGVPFQAAVVGGAGDGVAEILAVEANNRLVINGLADPTLAAAQGGVLYVNAQTAAGAAAEIASGSIVRINLFLRNSKIKGQGEP
jgi:hypothetical protein